MNERTGVSALLVLEDGRSFSGRPLGELGAAFGEIVFNTAMSGYQETLTDPSYYGQIVVMTAPHIGNTGVNNADPESSKIWVSGFVVRDAARRMSNWRAKQELNDYLIEQGIVSISEVDTRAITRHIREQGVMRAGIFSGDALLDPEGIPRRISELVAAVKDSADHDRVDLAAEVSTTVSYTIPAEGEELATVVAVDLGIKSMTPQRLAQRGVKVVVVPATSSIEDVLSHSPDGVFFSNGPGNPATATREVALLREVLAKKIPFFGICFGNQILGRALGFGTYKLPYGHRGVNQPVIDCATGKIEITTHNHGFAVDLPVGGPVESPEGFGRVEVSHVNLNDQVVEGIRCLDIPAFSVQYHPEAAAGPHDASYLFDRFVNAIKEN